MPRLRSNDGMRVHKGATKLAYTITHRFHEGRYLHFITATCAQCNQSQEFGWKQGDIPTLIAQYFRDQGWDFDPNKPRKCICGECKGKVTTVATKEEEESMAGEVVSMQTAAPKQPRSLTNAERQGIRRLLDEHFDDATGRYLDGYNDQRIGEELGIPWAHVTAIREAAYGVLKADPRIDHLRNELLDLKERIAKAERAAGTVISDLNQRVLAAEAKLAAIAKEG